MEPRSQTTSPRIPSLTPEHGEEAERVLSFVKRFGRQATAFQVLEPGLSYWFEGDQACVAYCDTGAAWVSAGEPLCEPGRIGVVAEAFIAAARRAGRRARFFHVSEEFVKGTGLSGTHIGEEPVWDPRAWPALLRGSRSLREQLRRARAKGVRAALVPGATIRDPSSEERRGCEGLITRWLGGRGMTEMKFMVLLHPFSLADERRYAVARIGDKIVGFGAAVPVYQRDGYFIEDLVRDPDAPNGTMELLVDTLMQAFAAEGRSFATLGLAPLAGDVSKLLAVTREVTAKLYNFPGVRAFKEKLKPERWDPVYLVLPRGDHSMFAIIDVLTAFAPGGILRFGVQALLHQRTLFTFALALFLVPWTLVLALADTVRWYPSELAQWTWVGFDALLCLLLFTQARRWTSWRARMLTVLCTADALVTTAQTLWWNVWTAHTWLAWCLVVVGSVGPALAAAFFIATRRVALGVRRAPRQSLVS